MQDLLASTKKEGGEKAVDATPNPFPTVRWVRLADGTRSSGELEDRAAQYFERENTIKANADFQGFKDVADHFIKKYGKIDGVSEHVSSVVYEWFEQQLVETVAGSLSMKHRKHWNPDAFDKLISDEALTASVMSRFHLMRQIDRALHSKFGKDLKVGAI